MDITELKTLIRHGESQKIEFKKSTAKLKSAAETLCAFLNTGGGRVFIGVTDGQKLVGQHVTDQTKLEIANILKKFEPSANISVDYVAVDKNKYIIILEANPDQRCVPYSFDGRAYERKESDTHLMNQSRYQQLLLSRNLNPQSWESQFAVGVSLEDLDLEEIAQTLKDIRSKKRVEAIVNSDNIEDSLKRLKLIEVGQLTNAAVVLFVKELSGNYMQCVLRMARFKGTEKGNFIDSRHIFGNAFQLLREAENFINRNTAIVSNLKTGKLTREDKPEYPFDAIREALINAICHRDYGSPGGSITITIFDDRLEIANSGTLPPDITLDDLKKPHTSHPRNPRIINVFYRRGFIEAMGIGTQEIIKSCIAAEMKEPEFFEQAGNFIVRLWSRHYKGITKPDMSELTERQKSILEALGNEKLAPKEILLRLKEKTSERTLRRELASLKELGYVESEGTKGWNRRWFVSR